MSRCTVYAWGYGLGFGGGKNEAIPERQCEALYTKEGVQAAMDKLETLGHFWKYTVSYEYDEPSVVDAELRVI